MTGLGPMLCKIKIAACQMTGQDLRHRLSNDEADCQMTWSETGDPMTKSEANCQIVGTEAGL